MSASDLKQSGTKWDGYDNADKCCVCSDKFPRVDSYHRDKDEGEQCYYCQDIVCRDCIEHDAAHIIGEYKLEIETICKSCCAYEVVVRVAKEQAEEDDSIARAEDADIEDSIEAAKEQADIEDSIEAAKEQAEEDDSIARAEDADIEDSIEAAKEDEMIEKIELATLYELRRRKLEHLKSMEAKARKKSDKEHKNHAVLKSMLDIEKAEVARIKASINEYAGDMYEFYVEAERVANQMLKIAVGPFTEDRYTRYIATFKNSKWHKK
jgi:hypothetical protein